jgi:enterochelin esterase-like enzyme
VPEIPYVRQPIEFPARYAHGPDSFRRPDVPRGALHEHEWNASRIFPGTERRYWVHVPAQYVDSEAASLMVFQDAEWYLNPDLQARAPIVLDNLIHAGEMPVTITVFVEPSTNRNAEYEAFDDAYAKLLLTEILPVVRERYSVTDDPDQWAIAGGSSGGVCAFTAAWMHPERFRRVVSFVGAFAQLEGGNRYPALIRQTPKKPLRVFLHTVTRDLNWNSPRYNFFSENLRVAAALAERGYDFRFVLGDGAHDGNHDGVILPDALRWLWQGGAQGATSTAHAAVDRPGGDRGQVEETLGGRSLRHSGSASSWQVTIVRRDEPHRDDPLRRGWGPD